MAKKKVSRKKKIDEDVLKELEAKKEEHEIEEKKYLQSEYLKEALSK